MVHFSLLISDWLYLLVMFVFTVYIHLGHTAVPFDSYWAAGLSSTIHGTYLEVKSLMLPCQNSLALTTFKLVFFFLPKGLLSGYYFFHCAASVRIIFDDLRKISLGYNIKIVLRVVWMMDFRKWSMKNMNEQPFYNLMGLFLIMR